MTEVWRDEAPGLRSSLRVVLFLLPVGLGPWSIGCGSRSAPLEPVSSSTSLAPEQPGLTGEANPTPGARERAASTASFPNRSNGGEQSSPIRFTDIVGPSGVDFVHISGMTPEKHLPSANGSGVAIFDYDNDGKLDLCFATGSY